MASAAAIAGLRSVRQAKSRQIVVEPAGILNHALQCSDGECGTQRVQGNDDPAAVRMVVHPVAAAASLQLESLLVQRLNELPCGDAASQARHKLTTTAGEGITSAPLSGSTGIGSPTARRSSK